MSPARSSKHWNELRHAASPLPANANQTSILISEESLQPLDSISKSVTNKEEESTDLRKLPVHVGFNRRRNSLFGDSAQPIILDDSPPRLNTGDTSPNQKKVPLKHSLPLSNVACSRCENFLSILSDPQLCIKCNSTTSNYCRTCSCRLMGEEGCVVCPTCVSEHICPYVDDDLTETSEEDGGDDSEDCSLLSSDDSLLTDGEDTSEDDSSGFASSNDDDGPNKSI